jgi:hypothetical protein
MRLNHLAVAEANAVASPAWQAKDKARLAYEASQVEYDAVWNEAYEIAKKADRNKDGYGIMPQ